MKIQGKRMMSTKTKHKSKILLFFLSVIAFLGLAIIIVPPQIHLNNLKKQIEEVIITQTGIPAKIHGNINFSLMGKATIVAHDISVPNGAISSETGKCKLSYPYAGSE